ncbi:MAG: hypothetical protein M0D54_03045 [Hyphomonadaceae bacterium JAD_PAG50586_4]|nr:MAG: hypothetical protein M0D54_03045 [Hyphomonadaceae bacterium JAD_PAG50586_4]
MARDSDLVEPFGAEHFELGFRIDAHSGFGGNLGFGAAGRVGEGEDLAVEIGNLKRIDVGDGEIADARAQQCEEAGAAHAANARDEDVRRTELLLLFQRDEA